MLLSIQYLNVHSKNWTNIFTKVLCVQLNLRHEPIPISKQQVNYVAPNFGQFHLYFSLFPGLGFNKQKMYNQVSEWHQNDALKRRRFIFTPTHPGLCVVSEISTENTFPLLIRQWSFCSFSGQLLARLWSGVEPNIALSVMYSRQLFQVVQITDQVVRDAQLHMAGRIN